MTRNHISVLNEKPLHAALKKWYARPGDRLEGSVDGYIIDIIRRDLLVEIQTGNFAAIKRKLSRLTSDHPVRLVYPVARDKWIVRMSEDGQSRLSRRRSPKRGVIEHIFDELVSLPELFLNPNLSLEVVFIQEEEVRYHDATRGWRRHGWLTDEHQLLEVQESRLFRSSAEIGELVPPDLSGPFTARDLGLAGGIQHRLAQKMVYCLSRIGCIKPIGKKGKAFLYTRVGNKSTRKREK